MQQHVKRTSTVETNLKSNSQGDSAVGRHNLGIQAELINYPTLEPRLEPDTTGR